jgi:5-methylcytosine-specific restriction endonuclease McrA
MKTCSKCGVSKPLSDFAKNMALKDGLQGMCRKCSNEHSRAWKAANPDRCKIHAVDRFKKNPEAAKAKTAARYAEHKEKYRAACAKWRANNQEKARRAVADWAAKNRQAILINQHNRRIKQRNSGKLPRDTHEKLYALQRGKCPCCGKPLGDDYHLDHIIPIALGGTNTFGNVQLLRATCNQQKYAKHPVAFMQERGFLL